MQKMQPPVQSSVRNQLLLSALTVTGMALQPVPAETPYADWRKGLSPEGQITMDRMDTLMTRTFPQFSSAADTCGGMMDRINECLSALLLDTLPREREPLS